VLYCTNTGKDWRYVSLVSCKILSTSGPPSLRMSYLRSRGADMGIRRDDTLGGRNRIPSEEDVINRRL
jgi:hypothetical protein